MQHGKNPGNRDGNPKTEKNKYLYLLTIGIYTYFLLTSLISIRYTGLLVMSVFPFILEMESRPGEEALFLCPDYRISPLTEFKATLR
ncbi:MAG: hypothetical protein A2Z29_06260 [Chloroflexi bacterium RBG_16_56_11]|nr:MAG: hypothetical protein A2Z29_06260 [Chloroflexi bacterium RBG_16_56_11]